jgi:hypothetical protein
MKQILPVALFAPLPDCTAVRFARGDLAKEFRSIAVIVDTRRICATVAF